MYIGVLHIVMAPQRCRRRRCTNSATRKTLLFYWIAASFSNTNRALVAVGFGFTTPSTTQYSRLQMGYDDVYDENDDVSSKEGDFQKKQPRKPRARMKKSVSSAHSSLLPPPAIGKGSNRRRWANIDSQSSSSCDNEGGNDPTVPKIQIAQSDLNEATNGNAVDESRRQGRRRQQSKSKSPSHPTTPITRDEISPEWGDLFSSSSSSQHDEYSDLPSITPTSFPTPVIEGVLPVSELFYRSTQSISSVEGEDDEDERDNDVASRDARAWKRTRAKSYKNAETDGETGDDEELPFSAEQSDRLSIPGNKIQIRRNKAEGSSQLLDEIATGIGIGLDGNKIPSEAVRRELKSMARQEQAEQRQLDRRLKQQQNTGQPQENDSNQRNVESEKSADMASKSAKGKKKLKAPKADRSSGRKMVRRGMEMLVGGEPINADPPQRAIELNYFNRHPRLWNRAITLNSPDFGPFLHMHAAGKISKKEVGLYAENFVHNAIKWNVCPDDLKDMVSENELRIRNDNAAVEHASAHDTNETAETAEDVKSAIQSSLALEGLKSDLNEGIIHDDKGGTMMFNPRELEPPKGFQTNQRKKNKRKRESRGGASGITSKEPNIRPYNKAGDISKDLGLKDVSGDSKLMFTLGGELKFSLGVTKSELEGRDHGKAFRRVLREGIGLSISANEMGFDVAIAKLVITDGDAGSTDVVVQFSLEPREAMEMGEAERIAKHVNGALASAMDDGKMAMALAQMAADEKGWSSKTRNRIVEEFLFETEDDEEDKEFDSEEKNELDSNTEDNETDDAQDELYDGPFGMAGDPTFEKDDLWLGGGNGGVFHDYSESNQMNSPYKGSLGPYLVDAAAQRASQNQPRLIAIGDVHGCIDELQALLKKCDYHPGDTVVFLGDLVCKGPDSLSVVQMAREIGAIGVRGNHDFEVVRWHQAIKSGADPPVIGSEHYYVASALSTADLKWMYTLPWFISSSHLNALFVHAGFVSGIRLAKQNPRLMMNMRSILPDGTVTSKFFNNWPWARLWDGPQTVFFGHDADRGLQQYEHAVGLDTGCVYGGKLTACILPERRLVSVNAKREYFQYRRKRFD